MQIRSKWWRWRGLPAILVSWVLAGIWVTVVAAHSVLLQRAEPHAGAVLLQSPPQVKLWFTEELQSAGSHFQLFDAIGQAVEGGTGSVDLTDPDHATMIAQLPTLPPGVYTVCWHALLIDGDVTTGSLVFGIGIKPAQPFACPTISAGRTSIGGIAWPWLLVGVLGILLTTVVSLTRRKATA